MAGTVTRTGVYQFGDTGLTVTYRFAYGDEYDEIDWDEDFVDEDQFLLVGDIVLDVTGPGRIAFQLNRALDGGEEPWASGVLADVNTPSGVPVGGPVMVVGDFTSTKATRDDSLPLLGPSRRRGRP